MLGAYKINTIERLVKISDLLIDTLVDYELREDNIKDMKLLNFLNEVIRELDKIKKEIQLPSYATHSNGKMELEIKT